VGSIRFFAYADGSIASGYGHLNRLANLILNLGSSSQTIFLYKNSLQKNFYDNLNFTSVNVEELYNFSDYSSKTLILDTKEKSLEFLSQIKPLNIVVIDSFKFEWIADYILIPTFYYDPSKHLSLQKIRPDKIIYGEEYIILSPKLRTESVKSIERNKLVISFGGSDPNNISKKVIDYLSPFYNDDIVLILGSGYSHDTSYFSKYLKSEQILFNPENIYEKFSQAYMIITALGVTLQEATFLNIPTGIVNNYYEDKEDLAMIKKIQTTDKSYSSIHSFGHFKKINYKNMISTISFHKKNKQNYLPREKYGIALNEFFTRIENKSI